MGRELVEKQLGELYESNRGARYSNLLIQARAAFDEGNFSKTLQLVKDSREFYRKRRKRTLERDPVRPDGKKKASRKERLAIEEKQATVRSTLATFDEAIAQLEPMARLQGLGHVQQPEEPTAELPDGFEVQYEATAGADARHAVVSKYFRLETVGSDREIRAGALFYVRGKESRLVTITAEEPDSDPVPLAEVPTGRRINPVPRQKLVELGRKAQLLRLVAKTPEEVAHESRLVEEGPDTSATGWQPPDGAERSHLDVVVDFGSFTQLMTAAQQSEMVTNAELIAQVRDRDFRAGRHRTAFEIIERMSTALNQAALTRQQKLRTEETDYKSGVLKMSPKEWQQKQQRDRQQTQKIQRARRNFTKVLDGLRILMISK